MAEDNNARNRSAHFCDELDVEIKNYDALIEELKGELEKLKDSPEYQSFLQNEKYKAISRRKSQLVNSLMDQLAKQLVRERGWKLKRAQEEVRKSPELKDMKTKVCQEDEELKRLEDMPLIAFDIKDVRRIDRKFYSERAKELGAELEKKTSVIKAMCRGNFEKFTGKLCEHYAEAYAQESRDILKKALVNNRLPDLNDDNSARGRRRFGHRSFSVNLVRPSTPEGMQEYLDRLTGRDNEYGRDESERVINRIVLGNASSGYSYIKHCLRLFDEEMHDRLYFLAESLKERGLYLTGEADIKKGMEDSYVLDTVYECMTGEEMGELVMNNKRYHTLLEEIRRFNEREKYIKQAMLKQIPEKYRDLYPLARQMKRKFYLHIGPTNSGKTYKAMERLKESGSGIYLAPLRLLAFEKYEELNSAGCPCRMVTGEEELRVEGARFQSSTVEIASLTEEYTCAVIDECQMVADPDRGASWTAAIMGLRCPEIHLCLAPEAEEIILRLIKECGDEYKIYRQERMTRLLPDKRIVDFPYGVRPGDALIVFSKRAVHSVAAEMKKTGMKVSIVYGALPYTVRQNEVRKFREKETDVVVSTDAIAMGMNLPVERVVFLEESKFDGTRRRFLQYGEIKQIAGRAGRYGIYDTGYAAGITQNMKTMIIKALNSRLSQISKAYVKFPESLIGIDAELSNILKKWKSVVPKDGFDIGNVDMEIELAKMLEEDTEDKRLIYDLVTITFDESDEEMKAEWYRRCRLVINEGRTEGRLNFDTESMSLDELERAHKYCDMVYQFERKFGNDDEVRESIQQEKLKISEAIMEKLDDGSFKTQKCIECGRVLPWDSRFPICEVCHRKRPTAIRRKRR